jgi:RNA polymerase sigma-70 factor (TIGR02943 family)
MGNEVALEPETWVDRHGDTLFRFAVLRVHDPETASDLVQETFLEALRARDTFSGRSSVRTWLVAILKHKIVDRLRRLGREQRFRGSEAPEDGTEGMFDRHGRWLTPPLDWGSDPLREYERREFWEVIGRCLARIPPHLADAFLDRELEGLSREAICRQVKITPENLSARLYRARLLLRRCLEVHWFHGRPATSEGRTALAWPASPRQAPEGT